MLQTDNLNHGDHANFTMIIFTCSAMQSYTVNMEEAEYY